MKLSELGEFGLIQRFAPRFKQPLPPGVEGIGDDCAIIYQSEASSLLITTDLLIEDIHFLKKRIPPKDLGYKSLAVSLSDIAAMGGYPRYAFLSLGLPLQLDVEWIDDFFSGFHSLTQAQQMLLLGGDTTRSPDKITINVLVVGDAAPNQIKRRSHARAGDFLCCTGYLGDSGGGLKVLLEHLPSTTVTEALVQKHIHPRLYLKEGQWLATHADVHAMLDISDGIDSDIQRLMEESRCGARIDLNSLPLSHELIVASDAFAWSALEMAVTSGEDYCLLVTIAPEAYDRLNLAYQARFHCPLFKIGEITSSPTLAYLKDQRPYSFTQKGFDHFFSSRRGYKLK